jgi:hypothetical protein
MSKLYIHIAQLCDERGIKPGRMSNEIGYQQRQHYGFEDGPNCDSLIC